LLIVKVNVGNFPQHFAAEGGCIRTMEVLVLDGRFDLQEVNEDGENVLISAVDARKEEMVSYLRNLLDIAPNITGRSMTSPSHIATRSISEITRLLLDDPRIDVNQSGTDGLQPLHWAAEEGELEI
jgi:ankyrin repeat protein